MDTIESLLREYTNKITRLAEDACVKRMLESVTGKSGKTKNGRKKGPIQLCPVPGCKKRAAPVFGMVCAAHAHVPKHLIAKYREGRRKAKVMKGKK